MPLKKKKLTARKPVKITAEKKTPQKPKKQTTQKKKVISKKSGIAQKPTSSGTIAGMITHYFPQIHVAAMKLKTLLKTSDIVHIKGHTTDFKQTVESMQLDHVPVKSAKKNEEVGILVNSRVRRHDIVRKL